MPCNSDYLDPDDRQKELQKAAKLLIFVMQKLGERVPARLIIDAGDAYCGGDYIPILCSKIKGLSKENFEDIVYDARDKTSRNLANWWEDHQAADKEREAKEGEKQRKEKIKKEILESLNEEQRKFITEGGFDS